MTDIAVSQPTHRVVDRLSAVRELIRCGEEAASEWQSSEVLAGLLDRGARTYFLAGEYSAAEAEWLRALTLNRIRVENSDAPRAHADLLSNLESLSRLYHHLNRLPPAIAIELEMISLRRSTSDPSATARALARAGSTMIDTKCFDSAEGYLLRAAEEFRQLESREPALARELVHTLLLLAVAHRHQGHESEATACERRAVDVAVRNLGPVAQAIRPLKATLADFAGQVAAMYEEVTATAAQLGGDGAAKGLVSAGDWPKFTDSLNALVGQVSSEVNAVAAAAGFTNNAATELDQLSLTDAVHDLSTWLEQAAIDRHARDVQFVVLERSARFFLLAEDFGRAEVRWLRALRFSDEATKRAEDAISAASARADSIRLLESLSGLYHAQGHLSSAIDTELELIEMYHDAGDAPGLARALARLGSTGVTAGRHDLAERNLARADVEFLALGVLDPAMASLHAGTLELLAIVHHLEGDPIEAGRYELRARMLRDSAGQAEQ